MYTVAEVANRLKVSPACVYQLVAEGLLECYRIGVGRGTIRFDEAQIAVFLAASKGNHPTPKPLKHITL